jgi:hypothetical protein
MSHPDKERFLICNKVNNEEKFKAISDMFDWFWEWSKEQDQTMRSVCSMIDSLMDDFKSLESTLGEEIKSLQSTNKKLIWALTHRGDKP